MRTSSSAVSSPRDPAERTTMKRYEVICHLLHGDFPWQHQYTLCSGCTHHSGQHNTYLRLHGGQCEATPSNPPDSLPL